MGESINMQIGPVVIGHIARGCLTCSAWPASAGMLKASRCGCSPTRTWSGLRAKLPRRITLVLTLGANTVQESSRHHRQIPDWQVLKVTASLRSKCRKTKDVLQHYELQDCLGMLITALRVGLIAEVVSL
eukprot:361741-Amphidinium_carterae.3